MRTSSLFPLRLLAAAVIFPVVVHAQAPAAPRPAQVTRLDGVLEAAVAEEGPWKPLKLKSPVTEGNILRTGKKSRAEISLPGDSVMRLGPETRLRLTKLHFPPGQKAPQVEARLAVGRVWSRVTRLFGAPDPQFRVSAGNAFAGVRGTAFEIGYFPLAGDNVSPDGATGLLKVYEGKVAVGRYDPFKPADPVTPGGIVPPRDVQGPGDVPPPFRDVTREEWTRILEAGMRMPFGVGDPATAEPEKIDHQKDMEDDFTSWNRELDGLTDLPDDAK
ncbi:MAG: FecR domain-containing protein [Deltaproteobacteria bacterium]|nr:FecR domain-containing protein [Deltaproteobacteria bacterium]